MKIGRLFLFKRVFEKTSAIGVSLSGVKDFSYKISLLTSALQLRSG